MYGNVVIDVRGLSFEEKAAVLTAFTAVSGRRASPLANKCEDVISYFYVYDNRSIYATVVEYVPSFIRRPKVIKGSDLLGGSL